MFLKHKLDVGRYPAIVAIAAGSQAQVEETYDPYKNTVTTSSTEWKGTTQNVKLQNVS